MKTLVLNGGANKTISYIGVLRDMCLNIDLYKTVKLVQGSSAGAIIGMMFCMNISPDEMSDMLKCFFANNSMSHICDFNAIDCMDRLWERLGITDNMTCVGSFVSYLLHKTWGIHSCTLSQFSTRTHKDFRIVVSNLTTGTANVISADSDPLVDIASLMCMTTCVPLLFEPIHWKDQLFVDGSLYGDMMLPDVDRQVILRASTPPILTRIDEHLLRYIATMISGIIHVQNENAMKRLSKNHFIVTIDFDPTFNTIQRGLDTACPEQLYNFLRMSDDDIDALIKRGSDTFAPHAAAWKAFALDGPDTE